MLKSCNPWSSEVSYGGVVGIVARPVNSVVLQDVVQRPVMGPLDTVTRTSPRCSAAMGRRPHSRTGTVLKSVEPGHKIQIRQ
jgi:hypothetical protein